MKTDGESPLSRARAAALAELRRAPLSVPWRREAARLAALQVGVGVLAAGAAIVAGIARRGDLAAHAVTVVALLALAALGGFATLVPGGRGVGRWRVAALVAAPAVMTALVVSRGAGLPSPTPEWVCSTSHVALGLLPLGLALAALRRTAWSAARAVAAGLGAGAAGALLGELACHRGAQHVLVHHVGAWLFIAAACVVISRRLRPQTFAP